MKKFLLALLMLIPSCAAAPVTCDRPHIEKTHYAPGKQVQAALESQDKDKVVYLIFAADWCPACAKLKTLVEQANAMSKVLFLNTDETWAFVLSRQLGVQGLPTMVIFKGGQPVEAMTDLNKIVMHLLIH